MPLNRKTKNLLLILLYLAKHPRRFYNALSAKGKKWALRSLIALLIIGIAVPTTFWYQASRAKAAWWNDSWQYRQKIQLTNSTGADLTDFQVSTTVDTASLITAGKMITTTCADMRFTDSRGQQLDYWIEENNPGCNSATTKVWVKAPKVYNGTNATSIYMYYGNPSASATQDGNKIFQFFDDFDDGTINPAKWEMAANGSGGSYTETGGQLQLTASNNQTGSATAKSIKTFTNNVVAEWRRYDTQQNYNNVSFGYGNVVGSDGTNWWHTVAQYGYTDRVQDNTNSAYWRVSNGFPTTLGIAIDGPDSGQWVKYKNHYTSAGNWVWSYDIGAGWAQLGTGQTDLTFLSNEKYFLLARGGYSGAAWGGTSQYDFFFTRKYASADPTTSASAEEIGPGPVAYWKFDEGQGTAAQDSTVNNLDGTLADSPSTPTWKPEADCVSGKCLDFDGDNDYVNVGTDSKLDPGGTNTFTISSWARRKTPTAKLMIADRRDTGGYILGVGVSGCTTNQIKMTKFAVADIYLGSFPEDTNWHHIVGVWSGTGTYLYIDGKLNDQSANTQNFASSPAGNTQIGGGPEGAHGYSSGAIDEVKIYPYARTAAQIQQDYNAGKAGQATNTGSAAAVGESPKWMTDGLVGHWKMDETSGTDVIDASGNANTGTLTNAQEAGTSDASGNSVTTMVDTDGTLSTAADAYNNMILRFTAACGLITSGTERTITDYTGTPHTFTVATLADIPNSCAYEVRHQTGGKFGNGLAFDGTNDHADTASNSTMNFANSTTFSFWTNRFSQPYTFSGPIFFGTSSQYWEIYETSNALVFKIGDGTTIRDVYAGFTTISSNTWYFVTYVYDEENHSFRRYVNGTLAQTVDTNVTSMPDMTGISGALKMGTSNYSGNYYFNGLLDDVRIYNRALSPDEVKQLSEWGPGPVGHWKMDENVSGNGQTIKDYSGNGNNATTDDGANNTGMDCTKQGKYGGACQFDGTDDQINLISPSSIDFGYSSFTYEAWVRPRNVLTSAQDIVMGRSSYGAWKAIMFKQNNTKKLIFGKDEITGYSTSTSSEDVFENDAWVHISCVYDRNISTLKCYKNGIPLTMSNNSISYILPQSTQYFSLGAYGGGGQNLDGSLDDVRVYNYARTSKQIVEDMNAGHPIGGSPVGSPVIQLKFDEGQGGTANNSGNGGSAQNGTMTPQGGGQTQTYQLWENGGKWGRAADLDGTDDYISIPDFSY